MPPRQSLSVDCTSKMAEKLFSPGFSDVSRGRKCGSRISTPAVSVCHRESPRFASLNPAEKGENRLYSRCFPNNLILFVLPFLKKPDLESVRPLSIHPQILAQTQKERESEPSPAPDR